MPRSTACGMFGHCTSEGRRAMQQHTAIGSAIETMQAHGTHGNDAVKIAARAMGRQASLHGLLLVEAINRSGAPGFRRCAPAAIWRLYRAVS